MSMVFAQNKQSEVLNQQKLRKSKSWGLYLPKLNLTSTNYELTNTANSTQFGHDCCANMLINPKRLPQIFLLKVVNFKLKPLLLHLFRFPYL